MMIITLLPFILAARVSFPASSWDGGEKALVTYLIQDQAIKTYSTGSNNSDEIFNFKSLLTCQVLQERVFCFFHEVEVQTTYADEKQGSKSSPKFMQDDKWLKKNLVQAPPEIQMHPNGSMMVWLPRKNLDFAALNFITALLSPFDIGSNFSSQLTGSFETKGNSFFGKCPTRSLVTRASGLNELKNLAMELFLINRPDEGLDRPVEILRKVEDENCGNKMFYLYSPYAAREFKTEPKDEKIEMRSFDNFITITQNNFTSFAKNIFTVTNVKNNVKYILDESSSITLQKIIEMKCSHDNENHKDCIDDRLIING